MLIEAVEFKSVHEPWSERSLFLALDGELRWQEQGGKDRAQLGPLLLSQTSMEKLSWEGELAYVIRLDESELLNQVRGMWPLNEFCLQVLEHFGHSEEHNIHCLNFLLSHFACSTLDEHEEIHPEAPIVLQEKDADLEPRSLVRRVLSYFEAHLTEKFVLQEVADAHGVSLMTLHNEFKKAGRGTPMSMLMSMRMQYAKDMVESSEVPFRQIAAEVGLSDGTSFSRRYKKEFGRSPREARKQAQWLC